MQVTRTPHPLPLTHPTTLGRRITRRRRTRRHDRRLCPPGYSHCLGDVSHDVGLDSLDLDAWGLTRLVKHS